MSISVAPPRWAFERVEDEKCRYRGLIPDHRNVDVWLRDPVDGMFTTLGRTTSHALRRRQHEHQLAPHR
jgi:hypothetical protein